MSIDYDYLFRRIHPFYSRNERIWRRNLLAYAGGKEYIRKALIRHVSEIDLEFMERRRRAYYFNYPRKIARLITQYVLATRPERRNADPELAEDWDRNGLRADEVMRQFSMFLNICGCAWLAVDMPSFEGEKTKEDELKERLRPYAVALSPLDVVDWCYASDGLLKWVLTAEESFDNSDPFTEPAIVQTRKLWTRDQVICTAKNSLTGEVTKTITDHGLGAVPFIRHVEVDGYGISESHWFEDVVRISDAILNNESEAQMNAVKQMFGMLVLPEDFVTAIRRPKDKNGNEEEVDYPHVLARSCCIAESVNGKGVSRYISPSGLETAAIRSENQNLRKEMFDVVGLAVSKDSKLVESAEAKMWDFQNVEQYMRTRADVLEQCEYRAWELMNLWNPAIAVPEIIYNRNFAQIDLTASIAALLELSGFNPDSPEYQKEIGKTAIALLNRLRQLAQDTQESISREIESSDSAVIPTSATPDVDKTEQV